MSAVTKIRTDEAQRYVAAKAKALSLTIPRTILIRANEVIE
jgi:hypothetical protein